jgi:hypothetical protein
MMKVSILKFVRVIIWGADMLVEAITPHLGDCFWGICLKYFRKKISKKSFKTFKIFFVLFC